MSEQDNFLERGFQLAYFIFPERSTAIRILTGALNKLKTQRERESRRDYWRDKYLKRGITRITWGEGDTLQWLILCESDPHEKDQEKRGEQTGSDMVMRYIKVLVRAGTAMSSFYVNIGLQRLLHSYSTSEAQHLFEVVTDRYPGADEYRRAKSMLMDKVLDRFGNFLTISRVQHGEIRFEAQDSQERWSELADRCLRAFIPWSTLKTCPVPGDFTVDSLESPLPLPVSKLFDLNQVEMSRCHAFIDPVCFGRLAHGLNFEPPQRKLALPRFNMENHKKHQPPQEGPPALTREERNSVRGELSRQSSRRRNARPASARLVVDGVERAHMSLSSSNQKSFFIHEGAELIELWSQDEDLLLAVHPIAYSREQGIAAEHRVLFRNRGRRLLLTISPEPETADQPRRAILTLRSQPGLAMIWSSGAGAAWQWSRVAGLTAGAAILLGIGWLLGNRMPVRRVTQEAVQTASQTGPSRPVQRMQSPVETARVYRMVPDELITRGDQGPRYPMISVPGNPQLVRLELPITSDYAHKSFRAVMTRFGSQIELLVENTLTAKPAASAWIVDFPVPSGLLQAGQDYTIGLQYRSTRGTLQEIESYTFRAR